MRLFYFTKRYSASIVFVLFLTLFVTLSNAWAQTSTPASEGKIVYRITDKYVPSQKRTQTIYSVNPDGSVVKSLFRLPNVLQPLNMSGDGSKIAYNTFEVQNGHSQVSIWTRNGNGTDPTKLPKVGNSTVISTLDKDGSKIAFQAADDNGVSQAYVVDSEGKHVVQVSFSPMDIFKPPVLNSSGSLVLLESSIRNWKSERKKWYHISALYIATADGKDGYQLTPKRDIESERNYDPAFNSNSQRVVYVSSKKGPTQDNRWTSKLCIINLDGSQKAQLIPSNDIYKSPHFSPDNKYIVFNRKKRNKTAKWQIWTVKADGSDAHCIVKGLSDCWLLQWIDPAEKTR